MLKIRRPLGRLIFNMGIAIPGKTVFLIETAPWTLYYYWDMTPSPDIWPVGAQLSSKAALHYNDVIMTTMASQITGLTIVYPSVYSRQIKENIKAPRHWPLWGEFTGHQWIPRTKGNAENISIWWRHHGHRLTGLRLRQIAVVIPKKLIS